MTSGGQFAFGMALGMLIFWLVVAACEFFAGRRQMVISQSDRLLDLEKRIGWGLPALWHEIEALKAQRRN